MNEAIATVDNFRPCKLLAYLILTESLILNILTVYKIYRREEWNAERQKSDMIEFDRTMDWVLIGHSVTPLCNDLVR